MRCDTHLLQQDNSRGATGRAIDLIVESEFCVHHLASPQKRLSQGGNIGWGNGIRLEVMDGFVKEIAISVGVVRVYGIPLSNEL